MALAGSLHRFMLVQLQRELSPVGGNRSRAGANASAAAPIFCSPPLSLHFRFASENNAYQPETKARNFSTVLFYGRVSFRCKTAQLDAKEIHSV
jgi:hypothetical protein